MRASLFALPLLFAGAVVVYGACAGNRDEAPLPGLDAGDDALGDVGLNIEVGAPDAKPVNPDPKTCEEAAESKSYVGCEFYPTPVANSVWDIFDFAAIVANTSAEEARVTVTGPNGFKKEAIVGSGRLVKLYLPWVRELKGEEADECGRGKPLTATVRANKSAYHVVTSRPVTVYQFNALQYEGKGGAPGKSWANCPGDRPCTQDGFSYPIGCYSFTNDASLLLPATALSGNYRITGAKSAAGTTSYVAITGTKDATEVTVSLGPRGRIISGGGLPYVGANGTATFTLNDGDVIQLLVSATATSDLSGSLIRATQPVQVIAGVPCITMPTGAPACDHIEEVVFPAETMGREYIVTMPTGPDGAKPGHVVRIYGNVDETTLSYKPSAPTGAPTTINAGEVIDLGVVKEDFIVTGTAEFAVGSFMLGGSIVDPSSFEGEQRGDPSMSMITSVEQFRTKYVFLAPDDYLVNYVDIVAPRGAKPRLDGMAVTETPDSLGTYEVYRVKLGPGPHGVGSHTLTADKAVGIQVLGYGLYTSYHYPGGLNLSAIAPPPVK